MIKGQKVKENNMSNYVISCCSTADLTREHMLERNIKYACFHYELDGKEYMDDLGQSMPLPDFYKAMEAGAMQRPRRSIRRSTWSTSDSFWMRNMMCFTVH